MNLLHLPFFAVLITTLCVQVIHAAAPASAPVTLRAKVTGQTLSVPLALSYQQVVLEMRSGAGWKPIAVQYRRNTGRERLRNISFTLPTGVLVDDLRVQGYRSAKFPARFVYGKRQFSRAQSVTDSGITIGFNNPQVVPVAINSTVTDVPVIESDIWQIVANQLFFFNQYRGLQVMDLSDPAHPLRTGTLRLPAAGEQMFVLNAAGTQLALLGRSNSKERPGAATLYLLRVTDGVPTLISELPLEGDVVDSRLMGSRLHLISTIFDASQASKAMLTSVDLSSLEAPQILGKLTFPGSQPVLQAAAGYLLLGLNVVSNTSLHVVNVEGAPFTVKTLYPRGELQDKFKMNIVKDAVVAVSLNSKDWQNRQTWVETFPLSGKSTAALAALKLVGARNEMLHATRFDGDRLYIVTFRNVDPLFVVDLEDPGVPVLSGVLEVPGWSTYLEPLGDRLLAVGVESGRVTVSLFDVADAAQPLLLDRLALGPEGGYSWSEANYDERAVSYLPDQGIVLLPFQTWEGQSQRVMQAVRVERDSLTALSTLKHRFNPRRGSWMSGYYVSISGQELLVQSAEDDKEPSVKMSLAWRTDRVLPAGDYLVQVEDGPGGNMGYPMAGIGHDKNSACLRITPANDPDMLVEELDLGTGQVVGLSQRGETVLIAQWVPESGDNEAFLRTWALDIKDPTAVVELDTVAQELYGLNYWDIDLGNVQPLWVNDETLVWFIPARQRPNFWWGGPIMIQPVKPTGTELIPSKSAVAVLCPVQFSQHDLTANEPLVVNIKGQVTNTSRAIVEAGLIFFSHDTLDEVRLPNAAKPIPLKVPLRPAANHIRSWLQVVDYRNGDPVLRSPVSIPGQLLGATQVDAQGAVILTQSDLTLRKNREPIRVVQASAYDGVNAYQLDTYVTATSFYDASATDGSRLYLTREMGRVGVVSIGYQSATGRLSQIASWTTNVVPSMLHVSSGHLLASSYGNLEVADIASDTGKLTPVASYDTPINLWLQVDRAAMTATLDFWIPAGDYGVEFLQKQALGQ